MADDRGAGLAGESLIFALLFPICKPVFLRKYLSHLCRVNARVRGSVAVRNLVRKPGSSS